MAGVYKWQDGKHYSGFWINNHMNGFGEFSWPDGRKYVGGYNNDLKEVTDHPVL